jgi:tetratricopeptide (TPR) repeat protein
VNVLLIGPQGSGKGTQAKRIASAHGLVHIATGDMLRDAVAAGTDLGRRVQPILASGRLVPDELMVDLIREGKALVYYSSDTEEMAHMCHRVLVMREGAAAAELAGDHFAADRIFVMQGILLSYQDRHDEARPILEEGFERCRRRGDSGFAATALDYRVVALVVGGDLRGAEQLACEALEIARPRGDFYDVGLATSHLAFVRAFMGDLDAARQLLEPLVRSVEGAPRVLYVPRMTQAMGRVALLRGDFETAREWFARDEHASGPMSESVIPARALPGLAAALQPLQQVST